MLNEKVLCISIIGVLAVGLSGCGCFGGCLSGCGCLRGGGCVFPSTSNTLDNLHVALYSEAEALFYEDEYRAAVEKYEQAFKIRPRRTKVIDVNYIPRFKYRIALCYTKLAETEGDVSLYIKAEAAIKESYQTAILQDDQMHILYLWGYILFKQTRYEESRTKYEKAIEISVQQRELSYFTAELYRLGKVYLAVGDEAVARRVFAQLEARIDDIGSDLLYALGETYLELNDETTARRVFAQLEARIINYVSYDIVCRLGKTYRELGDEAAAQRVFAQLERKIDDALQSGFPYIADELYRLGQAYMEHGDAANARRTFEQFLEHYPDSSYKTEVERLLEKQ